MGTVNRYDEDQMVQSFQNNEAGLVEAKLKIDECKKDNTFIKSFTEGFAYGNILVFFRG